MRLADRLAVGLADWGRWVQGRWGWVLAGALVASVLLAVGVWWRGVAVGGAVVVRPDEPGQARFAQWQAAFGGGPGAFVLIDQGADGANAAVAREAAGVLAGLLNDMPGVAKATWGFDPTTLGPRMLLVVPMEQVNAMAGVMAEAGPLLSSPTLSRLIDGAMRQGVQRALSGGGTSDDADASGLQQVGRGVVALMEAMTKRVSSEADEAVDLLAAVEAGLGVERWVPLETGSGRMLAVMVELEGGEAADASAVADVQRCVETVRQRYAAEGLALGMTGPRPVVLAATAEMGVTAAKAAAGVFITAVVLGALVWRSLKRSLVASGTAWCGVAWGVGLGVLAFGEVDVWAGVAALVTGLVSLQSAMTLGAAAARCGTASEAARRVGPGVAIAAVGLSAVGVLGYVAVRWAVPGASLQLARMGLWVTLGVTGVLGAWLTVGLSATAWAGRNWQADERVTAREDAAGMVAAWAERRPRVGWITAAVIAAIGGAGLAVVPEAVDLRQLLPGRLEAVQWLWRAHDEGGEARLAAASVAEDMDGVRRLVGDYRDQGEGVRLSGAALLVPKDMAAKQAALEEWAKAVDDAAQRAAADDGQAGSDSGAVVGKVQAMAGALQLVGGGVGESMRPTFEAMAQASGRFVAAANAVEDPAVRSVRLAGLEADYREARREVGRWVAGLLEDRPIGLSDVAGLDASLKGWMSDVGQPTQRLNVSVVPAEGQARTLREATRWVAAMRGVDAALTGGLERLVVASVVLQWATACFMAIGGVVLVVVMALLGRWRAGVLGGLLCVAGLGMQPIAAAVSDGGWTVVGGLLGWLPLTLAWGWVAAVAVAGARWGDADHDTHDPAGRLSQLQHRTAAIEGYGLTAAVLFVAAAAALSLDSGALTATAIGLCLAAAVVGLLGVLGMGVWQAGTDRG